ncbi:MAG: tetratricopeptide repeat protein [Vampirovibrionales bacterium]|nr:tetratricopeptide repeat protein [Vampirovibrionales bacterium]
MSKQFYTIVALSLSIGVLTGVCMPVNEADAAQKIYRSRASYNYSPNLRTANALMQTGKYSQAEAAYTIALKKNPSNLQARSALSVAQAELFKLDAAEKNANQVLAKDPNDPAAHVALGIVHRNRTASHDMFYKTQRDELLAKSAAELERATQLDTDFAEGFNQLGVTYRMQGRFNEAQSAFDRAMQIDPTYGEALLNEGIMKAERGDTSGAKESYREAMRINSKNHMAHYRMGEAYIAEGNYHEGLKHLNNALYLDKGNATIMSKMAEAYNSQGNSGAAVSFYRKAISANPAFMPAYVGLSNLFDGRGDGEAAMTELRSALNMNPNNTAVRNQLGKLALSVDKPDQALAYYRESVKINPNDADALQGLSQTLTVVAQRAASTSQALGQDSDLVDAEQAINEALQLNPNDMRLHLAALRISQLSGKPSASQAELERIVAMPSANDTGEMLKGEAYLSLGRYAEADQVFTGLMQRSSGDSAKLLLIGDTLKANGDLDTAEDAYQMVLSRDPNNLKAERGIQRIETAREASSRDLRLAKSLNNFWQKNSSVDFYEDSLKRNPRQPEARLALAKLYEKRDDYASAASSYQFYLGLMPNLEPKKRQRYEKKISRLQELAARQGASTQQTTSVNGANSATRY